MDPNERSKHTKSKDPVKLPLPVPCTALPYCRNAHLPAVMVVPLDPCCLFKIAAVQSHLQKSKKSHLIDFMAKY